MGSRARDAERRLLGRADRSQNNSSSRAALSRGLVGYARGLGVLQNESLFHLASPGLLFWHVVFMPSRQNVLGSRAVEVGSRTPQQTEARRGRDREAATDERRD